MNLKKLNQREKFLGIAVAGLILLAALYVFAYEPITKKLEDLDQEIQEKELILRRGIELSDRKDQLKAAYESVQGFLTAKGSDEELVANFLKEIGSKTRDNGVSLVDLKPQGKATKTAEYKKYLIDLSVEGNLEQVVAFIYGLETSEYVLKVERCVLSPKSEDSPVLKGEMLVSGIIIPLK